MALKMTAPSDVVALRQELLASHLERLLERDGSEVSPLLVRPFRVSPWARTMVPAAMRWDAASPNYVVAVDCLRQDAAEVARVLTNGAPGGRVVFSEVEKVVNWAGRPAPNADGSEGEAFDTTRQLWHHGMTVIDVDRAKVKCGRRTWHVVGGIARLTPTVSSGEG